MGPEFMMTWMNAMSSQGIMRSLADQMIDKQKNVETFDDFCERHDIDVNELIDDPKKARQTMRFYRTIAKG